MGTRAWMALALLCMGVVGAKIGVAADWSVVPAVELRSEYDSNINFTTYTKQKDYIFTLSPSAEFNYSTDISKLQGRLGLKGMHYLSQSHLDHVDQNYQINGNYAATPRLNFLLKSAYIVDTTLTEELDASGVIIGRTPRESILMNPGFSYALTEQLLATVTYNFNKVGYADPRFRNYATQQANLRLDYLLKDQKTTLIGNVVAGHTSYPDNDSFQSLGTYLGMNRKFSENWEATLVGGINYARLDFSTQVLDYSYFPFFILVKTARKKESAVNPYFSFSTTRRWTKASFTAGYSRDQSASAYGGVSQTNRVNLSFKYDFTERLAGNLYGDIYRSENTSELNSSKSNVYQFSPQITYRLTEKLSLTPAYRFGYREDPVIHRSANRHNVWLMLTYSYPIHYQR